MLFKRWWRLAITMLQQARRGWVRKAFPIIYLLGALLPAIWVLTHPMPVSWLRPVCKDTWRDPVSLHDGRGSALPALSPRRERLVVVGDIAYPGHLSSMVLQHGFPPST